MALSRDATPDEAAPKAHVVDDDQDARAGLEFLLSAAGLAVATYDSAAAFLDAASMARGVVVTDVRMPGMDGITLAKRLADMGLILPVIVMTGHADVPLAVEAMKAGVVDFIEKPYDNEAMLAAITAAMARPPPRLPGADEQRQHLRRFEALSARERQVLGGLVAGKSNKVIAYDLAISPRTVEIYRAHVMTKTGAHSLSELVRLALAAGLG
ncbi:MAG TPA: response regulator FixJ [Caulobacteraceae bacterium]